MSRIAVVTDSNSGITQAQAKELGVSVIPMPFMIDGETYYEEISLSRDEFYEKLAANAIYQLHSRLQNLYLICGILY